MPESIRKRQPDRINRIKAVVWNRPDGDEMRMLRITEQEAGQRLDKLLGKYMPGASRSFLCKMLRKKNIELNHKKAEPGALLSDGDEICLFLSEETIEKFRMQREKAKPELLGQMKPVRKVLSILYEDENVILADKPAGLLSQKAGPGDVSLNELLLQKVMESAAKERTEAEAGMKTAGRQAQEGREDTGAFGLQLFRPSVCNRLDRNTSGIVSFAKTYQAARALSALFSGKGREHQDDGGYAPLEKYYLCLVKGRFTKPVKCSAWLKKEASSNQARIFQKEIPGADRIVTAYEPLLLGADITLLKIQLFTGKSHQIRAHLQSLGYPVLGDPKYGDADQNGRLRRAYGVRRQLLHAWLLVFPAGLGGSLSALSGRRVYAPVPADFEAVLCDNFSEEQLRSIQGKK